MRFNYHYSRDNDCMKLIIFNEDTGSKHVLFLFDIFCSVPTNTIWNKTSTDSSLPRVLIEGKAESIIITDFKTAVIK